jgi:hypothetical protein
MEHCKVKQDDCMFEFIKTRRRCFLIFKNLNATHCNHVYVYGAYILNNENVNIKKMVHQYMSKEKINFEYQNYDVHIHDNFNSFNDHFNELNNDLYLIREYIFGI